MVNHMKSDRIKAPNNLDNYGKSRSLNGKISMNFIMVSKDSYAS